MTITSQEVKAPHRRDWIAALVLFFATAVVVVWQNFRLGVLWDLSYILENSYRISLGDIPYRDFPLAHPPITFLIQAALIKLTGRVFFHHELYCAAVGGLATLLTWRILLNLLRSVVSSAWWVAFFLSAPLTVLGIYCIFPHPFYDPDCTFALLICILLLQQLDLKGFPPLRSFVTGAALVVPLFIKQNTGLAFLASAGLMLAIVIGREAWHHRAVAGYVWLLAGAAAGLTWVLLFIHLTSGLANYEHWTVSYAVSRRMPRLADLLSVYQEHAQVPWWVATYMAGALLLRVNPRGKRSLVFLSVSLMALPFAWTCIFQFAGEDSSDRAELLLAMWPFLLIVTFIFALFRVRERRGIAMALPFIVIGTIHGGFLSQQLWGSTYAMWPLLVILVGTAFAPAKQSCEWSAPVLTYVVSVSLLIAGGFYVGSHERLDYAKLSGEVVRPELPALAGLSVPGPWIPQFEQLVHFTEREVPWQEGLLMIPGEDLFYYATGRRPRFPVLVFDHTANPYDPEEILELSRSRRIGWLIVKRNVQLEQDPVEDKDRLLKLLRQEFKRVKSLDNYDVYRQTASGGPSPARANWTSPCGVSLHCIPRQAVHDLWADLFQRQYFSANPRLRREPRHSPNYADCFILRDQSCGYGHRGSASVLWSCPMRHPDHRTPCPGAARKWNLGFRKIFLCTCLRRVINASNHTIWMNREALKEFGITRNTQKVNLCRKREKDAKRGEPTSNRHLRQQWTCSFWGQRLGPHGQYRFFRKPGISRAIKG